MVGSVEGGRGSGINGGRGGGLGRWLPLGVGLQGKRGSRLVSGGRLLGRSKLFQEFC